MIMMIITINGLLRWVTPPFASDRVDIRWYVQAVNLIGYPMMVL